jgi:transcription elongation GreA/GreB family factor
MKPSFTKEEINELQDLSENSGYIVGIYEVINFLEKRLSKVHSIVIDIRKEFMIRRNTKCTIYQEKYKDSKLIDKLIDRLDYERNIKSD